MAVTAEVLVEALIAMSDDKIWATELDLLGGTRRIDFWTLEPIKSKGFKAIAYEIKVSREDFRRDSRLKQNAALQYSDRFYYVMPQGLVSKGELPSWAGLLEYDGKALKVTKKAPVRFKEEPTWWFIVSLMRNSGRARRDVGLLKNELSYYKMVHARETRIRDTRSGMAMQRWLEAKETDDGIDL